GGLLVSGRPSDAPNLGVPGRSQHASRYPAGLARVRVGARSREPGGGGRCRIVDPAHEVRIRWGSTCPGEPTKVPRRADVGSGRIGNAVAGNLPGIRLSEVVLAALLVRPLVGSRAREGVVLPEHRRGP